MSQHGINQYMQMLSDTYPFNLFRPECAGETIFPPHWHDRCLELIYFRAGSAELHIGGSAYTAAAGDLFLIGEGVIHSGYLLGALPESYTILLDRRKVVASDLYHIGYDWLLSGNGPLPVRMQPGQAGYEELIRLVESIIDEFKSRSVGYEAVVKSYLHILLTLLGRRFGTETGDAGNWRREADQQMRRLDRLKASIMLIEQEYSDKLTVGRAANAASMSPYHFCRVFKDTVGRTFSEYLQLYRVARAAELLAGTDLPVALIAEQTGLTTAQNMGALFRRHRGVSPTQYRKSSRTSAVEL